MSSLIEQIRAFIRNCFAANHTQWERRWGGGRGGETERVRERETDRRNTEQNRFNPSGHILGRNATRSHQLMAHLMWPLVLTRKWFSGLHCWYKHASARTNKQTVLSSAGLTALSVLEAGSRLWRGPVNALEEPRNWHLTPAQRFLRTPVGQNPPLGKHIHVFNQIFSSQLHFSFLPRFPHSHRPLHFLIFFFFYIKPNY